MKKNIISKVIIFFILFIFIGTASIYADDLDNDNEPFNFSNEIDSKETSSGSISDLKINSRAYVVIDRKSKQILISKNETEKRKMASTTKIMTAILILENGNLKDTVTVSKKAAGTGGSRLGLKTNDKVTVHDLLYGLMLCSGNDAAVCLAEYLSGSVSEFANLMNKKARDLGLTNTNFVTPHGLDSDEHYTTAYELALLSNYALNNEKFKQIVGTKSISVTINGYPKTLSNTNELLGNLNGVYGIKTGFTNGANRCLVTACKRDEMDIICVVLGADTKKFRTQDSIKLIEYTFKNFEYVDIETIIKNEFENWKKENLNNFIITKAIPTSLEFSYSPSENSILPIFKNDIPSLSTSISANYLLFAPVTEGSVVGEIKISSNDKVFATTKILLSCNIEKKNSFYYLFEFLKNYPNILINRIKIAKKTRNWWQKKISPFLRTIFSFYFTFSLI